MKILHSVLMLVTCGVLAGCGSSYSSEPILTTNDFAGASTIDAMYVDDYVSNEYQDYIEEPMEAEVSGFTKEDASKYTEKLVYEANLTVETSNYDDSVSKLKDICTLMDCFIESEQMRSTNRSWYDGDEVVDAYTLDISIRVPSDVFDTFVDSVGICGKVTSKALSATNITQEYYDTQSVIDSLEVQESRLLDMMDQAYTIEDMITVENRLTDVQTRINQHKTRIGIMDMQVSYSTVNITVDTVQTVQGDPDDTSTFFSRLGITIRETIDSTLKFLERALFAFIGASPALIFLLALLVLYWKFNHVFDKKKVMKGIIINEEKDENSE